MGRFPRLTPVQLSPQVPDLMTVSALDLIETSLCVEGYIGSQSLAAIVRLKGLMAGSCSAIMSIPIFTK